MLDGADFERDRPVRVVVADRGRDQEPPGELRVDDDLVARIELIHEPPLDIRVRDDVVIDMVFQFRADLGEERRGQIPGAGDQRASQSS